MAESPSDAEADARGVERRLRPTNWRQIKLGTGTTNLSHTHPVLVAAQAAMLDHLLKGRFLFGVSTGALESDAEALGIRGIDRNEMFAESIGHIIDIWRGEPPYDLEGKHWTISTRETLHPEISVGPIPKPYQKPHPPILATVVAPFSKGVRYFRPRASTSVMSAVGITGSIYGSSLEARSFGAVSGNACAHCGSGMTVVTSCLVLRAISMGSVPELSRIWTVSKSSYVSRRFAHAAVQRLLTSASPTWCPPSSTRLRTRRMLIATVSVPKKTALVV